MRADEARVSRQAGCGRRQLPTAFFPSATDSFGVRAQSGYTSGSLTRSIYRVTGQKFERATCGIVLSDFRERSIEYSPDFKQSRGVVTTRCERAHSNAPYHSLRFVYQIPKPYAPASWAAKPNAGPSSEVSYDAHPRVPSWRGRHANAM